MLMVMVTPSEAEHRGRAALAIKTRFPLEKTYQGNLAACLGTLWQGLIKDAPTKRF